MTRTPTMWLTVSRAAAGGGKVHLQCQCSASPCVGLPALPEGRACAPLSVRTVRDSTIHILTRRAGRRSDARRLTYTASFTPTQPSGQLLYTLNSLRINLLVYDQIYS